MARYLCGPGECFGLELHWRRGRKRPVCAGNTKYQQQNNTMVVQRDTPRLFRVARRAVQRRRKDLAVEIRISHEAARWASSALRRGSRTARPLAPPVIPALGELLNGTRAHFARGGRMFK